MQDNFVLQVTLLKDGELLYDEDIHATVLHGLVFAGIGCDTSINKSVSESAIIIDLDKKGNFKYKGVLNGVAYTVPSMFLNAANLAMAVNRHMLKINDVNYLMNDLYVLNLYGKMKYGFSDTKNRSGENSVIITPFFSCVYNISSAKNLGKVLAVASHYASVNIGEAHGIKNALITTNSIKSDWSHADISKNKNFIIIKKHIKTVIDPMATIYKFKFRMYSLSLSDITATVRYTSDKKYIMETITIGVSSNIDTYSKIHNFVNNNIEERYIGFLNGVIKSIAGETKILGGIKNKFIKGLDQVIEEYSTFTKFK